MFGLQLPRHIPTLPTAAGPDRRRLAPAVGPPPADGERRLSGALLPLPTGTIEATLIAAGTLRQRRGSADSGHWADGEQSAGVDPYEPFVVSPVDGRVGGSRHCSGCCSDDGGYQKWAPARSNGAPDTKDLAFYSRAAGAKSSRPQRKAADRSGDPDPARVGLRHAAAMRSCIAPAISCGYARSGRSACGWEAAS
jgi:hypothetical protein